METTENTESTEFFDRIDKIYHRIDRLILVSLSVKLVSPVLRFSVSSVSSVVKRKIFFLSFRWRLKITTDRLLTRFRR